MGEWMSFPKGKQPKGRAAVFRNPEAGKAGSATVCGSGAVDQDSQKAAGKLRYLLEL